MKNFRLIGLLLFILMMGNSCKTYKNLERVEPRSDAVTIAEHVRKLKSGDAIKVHEITSGRVTDLEYVITEDGILRGFQAKGSKSDLTSIKLEDIARIEVKKFNAGKTVLTTGVVVASAFVVAFLVHLVSIIS
jgi:hypothetical protein